MVYLENEKDYKLLSEKCLNYFKQHHGSGDQIFKAVQSPLSYHILIDVYSQASILNFRYFLYIVDDNDFPETFDFNPFHVKQLNSVQPEPNSGKRVLLVSVNKEYEPFDQRWYGLTSKDEIELTEF